MNTSDSQSDSTNRASEQRTGEDRREGERRAGQRGPGPLGPGAKSFTLFLPRRLYDSVDRIAERNGVTRSTVVRDMIRRQLEQQT